MLNTVEESPQKFGPSVPSSEGLCVYVHNLCVQNTIIHICILSIIYLYNN